MSVPIRIGAPAATRAATILASCALCARMVAESSAVKRSAAKSRAHVACTAAGIIASHFTRRSSAATSWSSGVRS